MIMETQYTSQGYQTALPCSYHDVFIHVFPLTAWGFAQS